MNKKLAFALGGTAIGLALGILAGCGNNKLYKITFDSKGGTPVAPIEIQWGQTPTMPEDPTRNGYTFAHWFEDEGYSKEYVVAPVENDFTLYAKWDINQYTVSFETNGGTPVAPIKGDFGTEITVPETTKDYYIFGGWYTDTNFTKEFNYKIPSSDITVFAKWIPNKLTISFDKNSDEARGEMSVWQVSQDSENKKLPRCLFSRDGYDFKGWSLTSDGLPIYLDEQDLVNVPEDGEFTLYAVWEIKHLTANFYASGSLTEFATKSVDYGAIIELPIDIPTYTGYTFVDWGVMTRTSDTKFLVEKEYFTQIGDSGKYQHANVKTGESITTPYYEVVLGEKPYTAGNKNDFYALFKKNQYTITFKNAVTDADIGTVTEYYGESIKSMPNAPLMEGYTSTGWYDDKECSSKINTSTLSMGASNRTIYAGYMINSYNLTLVKNNGSANETKEFVYNYDISGISDPTKAGYDFGGWYEDEALTIAYTLNKMPAKDLTLYAKYNPKYIKITLNNNGGTGAESVEGLYNSPISAPSNPTKEGHTFKGWFSDVELTKSYTFQDKMLEVENITVYAKWEINKHNINFDSNAGSNVDPITGVEYGASLADKAPIDPTRLGYNFDGWYNGVEKFDFASAKMGDADLNLTAHWSAADVKIHIIYKGEDLTGNTYSIIKNDDTKTAKTESRVEITKDTAEVPENYVFEKSEPLEKVNPDHTQNVVTVYCLRKTFSVSFVDVDSKLEVAKTDNVKFGACLDALPNGVLKDGFSTFFYEDEGCQNEIESVLKYTITQNTTIYVKYEQFEGVTFSAEGGIFNNSQSVYEVAPQAPGEVVPFPEENPTRKGYTFEKWVDKDGNTVTAGTLLFKNVAQTIKAVWTINQYEVTLIDNGKTTALKYDFGSVITLTHENLDGYTFDGWYNDKDVKYNNDTLTVEEDITLHTVYNANKINITFHNNGGSGSMNGQTVTYGTTPCKLTANAFTKTGYTFVGWATSEGSTEVSYVDQYEFTLDDFTETSKDLDLYAIWQVGEFTITFDSMGGSEVSPITAKYGETISAPANPTRKGYTFAGWATKEGEGVYKPYTFSKMDAADITLYAQWTINKYSVIFESNGGSAVVDPLAGKHEFGSSLADGGFELPANPTKAGNDFVGWFTKDGSKTGDWGVQVTADNLKDIKFTEDADIHLYALWSVHKHSITYYADASNVPYEVVTDIEYNTKIEDVTDPEKELYEFAGWTDIDGNPVDSIVNMPDTDLVFYAQFTPCIVEFYGENNQLLYSCTAEEIATNPIFNMYIKKIYGEVNVYKFVADAIQKAVESSNLEEALAAGIKEGSLTPEQIAEYMAQIKELKTNIAVVLAYQQASLYTDDQLILQAMISQLGAGSDDLASQTKTIMETYIPDNEYKDAYYDLLVKTSADALEAAQEAEPGSATLRLIADIADLQAEVARHPNETYAAIYQTIADAAYKIVAEQDASAFMPYAVYANIIKTNNFRNVALTQGIIGALAGQGLEGLTKEVILPMVNTLSGITGENAELYYALVAQSASESIPFETASEHTNARLTETSSLYVRFKENAYYPFSTNANKAFNGWKIDTNDGIVSYQAQFITKMNPIHSIYTTSITGSSVTFAWDSVDGAWGYRVSVNVNGEFITKTVTDKGTLNYVDVRGDNFYTITPIKSGDIVNISVASLKADENGELIETSLAGLTNKAIENPDQTLTLEPLSLTSDFVDRNYYHALEEDMGKVEDVGNYYYKMEDGTYIFFTNNIYTFGGKEITIIDNEASVLKGTNDSGKPALITQEKTGTVIFNVEGEDTNRVAEVRQTPELFASGSNMASFEDVEVSSDTTSPNSVKAQYLGKSKQAYKLGTARKYEIATTDVDDIPSGVLGATYGGYVTNNKEVIPQPEFVYYNGFKFDVDSLSTIGSPMKMDKDYTFYLANEAGDPYGDPIDPSTLYTYDEKNDVFYFNAGVTGKYYVEITPKADEGEYINNFVPNAFKSNTTKMNKLFWQGVFEINDGLNIFDDSSLRAAFDDDTTTNVNIHANIDANFPANGVAYVPHAKAVDASSQPWILDGLDKGDVDIVDRTAVMELKKNDSVVDKNHGPFIWDVTTNKAEAVFTGKDNVMYKYAGTGGKYRIIDAEWKSNFDEGSFKIVNRNADAGVISGMANNGYRTANCYERIGTECETMTVNGNYFTVSTAKLPHIRSAKGNTAGGAIATYHIQDIAASAFLNSSLSQLKFNNMTLIGNTSNASQSITTDGTGAAIAEQMRITSGGLDGFFSYPGYGKAPISETMKPDDCAMVLNGVNAYAATISFYGDAGISCNYCHSRDSWANTTYSWDNHSFYIHYENSVIESSGGAAIHIDDAGYDTTLSTCINPRVDIDFASCYIANLVSGEEQWFKAYSMEVMALKLKTSMDSAVRGMGFTILQEVTNPVTGLTSECMNWVFFYKTDAIKDQSSKRAIDIGDQLTFGKNYCCMINEPSQEFMGGFVFAEFNSQTGQPAIYDINESGVGKLDIALRINTSATQPIPNLGEPLMLNPEEGAQNYVYAFATIDINVGKMMAAGGAFSPEYIEGFTIRHIYLYFRISQEPLGYIGGLVELYQLPTE